MALVIGTSFLPAWRTMIVFRVRVLPGCFVFILQLEQGVCDDQLMLRAEGEETETIVIDLTNTVLANHFFP